MCVVCIRTLSRLAVSRPTLRMSCIRVLALLLKHCSQLIVSTAVLGLRELLLSRTQENNKAVVLYTLKILDKIGNPSARGAIIWLLGEYLDVFPSICMEALRKLVLNFSSEHTEVKLKILGLAMKMLPVLWGEGEPRGEPRGEPKGEPKTPKEISIETDRTLLIIFRYLVVLAEYDASLVVRQKARLLLFFKGGCDQGGELLRELFISGIGGKGEEDAGIEEGALEAQTPAHLPNCHLHTLSLMVFIHTHTHIYIYISYRRGLELEK